MMIELKIWYDGISRTVSGVSEDTTCQEVVIALIQAVGQSGRFVLKEKSVDGERFLAPSDHPVRAFAKRGLYSNNVQLILCRTDQSHGGPGQVEPEKSVVKKSSVPLRRSTFKEGTPSYMFTSKKSTSHSNMMIERSIAESNINNNAQQQPQQQQQQKQSQGAGLIDFEFTFNEWMDLISMQQQRIDEQKTELETLDQNIIQTATTPSSDGSVVGVVVMATSDDSDERLSTCTAESDLERVITKNDIDLNESEFWEDELELEELDKKNYTVDIIDLKEKLSQLDEKLSEHKRNVQSDRALIEKRRLEVEEQTRVKVEEKGAETNPPSSQSADRDAIKKLTLELDRKTKENLEHKNLLAEMETEIKSVEKNLSEKTSRLEDLGKEIRQANLQEFIRQTTPPPDTPGTGNSVKHIIGLKTVGANSNTTNSLPRTNRNVLSLLKNLTVKQCYYTISTTDMPDGVWV